MLRWRFVWLKKYVYMIQFCDIFWTKKYFFIFLACYVLIYVSDIRNECPILCQYNTRAFVLLFIYQSYTHSLTSPIIIMDIFFSTQKFPRWATVVFNSSPGVITIWLVLSQREFDKKAGGDLCFSGGVLRLCCCCSCHDPIWHSF